MKTNDITFKESIDRWSPLKKDFMVYRSEYKSKMIVKQNLTYIEARNECVKLQKEAKDKEHYLIGPMKPAKVTTEVTDFFVIDGR